MKQQYFILVLAHSLHGRLRRVHIPHHVVYAVLALAVLGCFSLFGFLSSYFRMALKVSSYNSLRQEVQALRERYQQLERDRGQKEEQLATLQLFASEVSIAYGIKRKLEGPADIANEGRLVPTLQETLEDYDFLKSTRLSSYYRRPTAVFLNGRPSIWPVSGRLLSHFGARIDPFSGEGAFHTGVDISAPTGTPVKAAADGIVVHAGWNRGYGKIVVLEHPNGIQTYYAHLSRFEVIPGQEVRQGETIARSGATGRVTTAHLHYEVRIKGSPFNPYPYMNHQFQQARKRDLPF